MSATATQGNPRNPISPSSPAAISKLSRFIEREARATDRTPQLVGPDGETIDIPTEIYEILTEVVREMQAGHSVSVTPVTQRITTQQAADMLGISRPTLVKLVETGAIAYEKPGRHRRLLLTDVLQYRDDRHRAAMGTLDELTGEASEAGLYDVDAASYEDALKRARASKRREK